MVSKHSDVVGRFPVLQTRRADRATAGAVNYRHARDQWLRAARSISLNIAEGNGKQSLKDKNRFFEIARGSAMECAAIRDVLLVCDAIDDDSNCRGKSDLKRIVSMLTRLIQRTLCVSERSVEYEYEYRPGAPGLSRSTGLTLKPDEQIDAHGAEIAFRFFLKPRSHLPALSTVDASDPRHASSLIARTVLSSFRVALRNPGL